MLVHRLPWRITPRYQLRHLSLLQQQQAAAAGAETRSGHWKNKEKAIAEESKKDEKGQEKKQKSGLLQKGRVAAAAHAGSRQRKKDGNIVERRRSTEIKAAQQQQQRRQATPRGADGATAATDTHAGRERKEEQQSPLFTEALWVQQSQLPLLLLLLLVLLLLLHYVSREERGVLQVVQLLLLEADQENCRLSYNTKQTYEHSRLGEVQQHRLPQKPLYGVRARCCLECYRSDDSKGSCGYFCSRHSSLSCCMHTSSCCYSCLSCCVSAYVALTPGGYHCCQSPAASSQPPAYDAASRPVAASTVVGGAAAAAAPAAAAPAASASSSQSPAHVASGPGGTASLADDAAGAASLAPVSPPQAASHTLPAADAAAINGRHYPALKRMRETINSLCDRFALLFYWLVAYREVGNRRMNTAVPADMSRQEKQNRSLRVHVYARSTRAGWTSVGFVAVWYERKSATVCKQLNNPLCTNAYYLVEHREKRASASACTAAEKCTWSPKHLIKISLISLSSLTQQKVLLCANSKPPEAVCP
ncbi:unnamed protein product [Rangifer tarandus platyrhynchus]|uniref:Uncharacterized protein n=1 Tax=Rangifer tarandus platyrhynchus TaxID=3082113 RepID=A0ABN8XLV1_RANTA|nr:unnamed protein product [Rangifer tarandus platyrhynchus]